MRETGLYAYLCIAYLQNVKTRNRHSYKAKGKKRYIK